MRIFNKETQEEIPRNLFSYQFYQYNDGIFINFNFTEEGEEITGYVRPLRPYMFLNTIGKEPLLMFPDKPVWFNMTMVRNEEPRQIDLMKDVGQKVDFLIRYFGIVLATVLGISTFSGNGALLAVKMLSLFKIIYR